MAWYDRAALSFEVSIYLETRPTDDHPTHLEPPDYGRYPMPPPTPGERLEHETVQRVIMHELKHIPHEHRALSHLRHVRLGRQSGERGGSDELAAAYAPGCDIEHDVSISVLQPEPDLPVRAVGWGRHDRNGVYGLLAVEGADGRRICCGGGWEVEITEHLVTSLPVRAKLLSRGSEDQRFQVCL
jgi:hypothetical protein